MKIHEYQAQDLFRQMGLPVPMGKPAFTVDEAGRS
jgi:succinyl-CoA synthetase beta subunit